MLEGQRPSGDKDDGSGGGLDRKKIGLEWSPGQISGWLGSERGIAISHERICQHVWADKRGQIRNRVSIDERPAVVGQKTRAGDWEIDTVIGKNHQGALVTIVDRVSKFTLIKKAGSKHAEVVTEATVTLLKPYLDKILTITADNGKEFAGHESIAKQLDAAVYFAHPYRSWERGTDENTNGLIRQYFTKGSSFENITDGQVEEAMGRLNHRPRKTLKYKTPHAVFFGNSERKAA